MKKFLVPILLFLLTSTGCAFDNFNKEKAEIVLKRWFQETKPWTRVDLVFLNSGGSMQKNILRMTKEKPTESLLKRYKNLKELVSRGLAEYEITEEPRKYVYRIKLTDKFFKNNHAVKTKNGWFVSIYRQYELVSIDKISSGVSGIKPNQKSIEFVYYTFTKKVSEFGKIIGKKDKKEHGIEGIIKNDNRWIVDDSLSKAFGIK